MTAHDDLVRRLHAEAYSGRGWRQQQPEDDPLRALIALLAELTKPGGAASQTAWARAQAASRRQHDGTGKAGGQRG